jgi:Raf kinase inhibitor-like YbhB/YbcL family protein
MKPKAETNKDPLTLQVMSPAFGAGAAVPIEFTADGEDIAPPLCWSGAPEGTKSFALLVEDPDAFSKTWVHWIVTGIPADCGELTGDDLPDGATHGTNDWGQRAYGGPCPPHGRHRYFFKVFALDFELRRPGMTKTQLLSAIDGHVLARGEMIAIYERPHEYRSAEQAEERSHPH